MKKSKKTNRKNPIKRFLEIFSLTIVLFFVSSLALTSIADNLVLKDNFSKAEIFYQISKIVNPLNVRTSQGLQIARVLGNERKGDSEETSFNDDPAANEKYVLGASATVPVLMYHYIRYNPDPNDKVGWNLSVTPDNFSAHLDYLQSHGYHTITLDELGANLYNNTPLPSKPIVITLDDGYKDAFTQAYPILKSHGMKATDFVITGFTGGPGFMSWDDMNQMKDTFTFESHTVNHIALTYSSDDRVLQELTNSRNALRDHLGYVINWFAYPFGNVDTRVAQLTAKAGFVGAFGTNFGSYHSKYSMFTLPRVRMGGGDTAASLASKLPY